MRDAIKVWRCARCGAKQEFVAGRPCLSCGSQWVVKDPVAAALQEALALLADLRDCPLTELERRQAEIDAVIAAGEAALAIE